MIGCKLDLFEDVTDTAGRRAVGAGALVEHAAELLPGLGGRADVAAQFGESCVHQRRFVLDRFERRQAAGLVKLLSLFCIAAGGDVRRELVLPEIQG